MRCAAACALCSCERATTLQQLAPAGALHALPRRRRLAVQACMEAMVATTCGRMHSTARLRPGASSAPCPRQQASTHGWGQTPSGPTQQASSPGSLRAGRGRIPREHRWEGAPVVEEVERAPHAARARSAIAGEQAPVLTCPRRYNVGGHPISHGLRSKEAGSGVVQATTCRWGPEQPPGPAQNLKRTAWATTSTHRAATKARAAILEGGGGVLVCTVQCAGSLMFRMG